MELFVTNLLQVVMIKFPEEFTVYLYSTDSRLVPQNCKVANEFTRYNKG